MSGRPLRFLGATVIGWVAMRVVMLWPTAGPAALPRALVPAAFADSAPAVGVRRSQPPSQPAAPTALIRHAAAPAPVAAMRRITVASPPLLSADSEPEAASMLSEQAKAPRLQGSILAPSPAFVPERPSPNHWSASGWFVLREGRGIAPGPGDGQLGGSQAGLRIAYTIGRIAVVGRVASPLHGSGREAALGVEWRPTRLPVRLAAEYRHSLDGGASGPALGAITGTGPAPLVAGLDLETYAQAGLIRRRTTEAYAEGSARLARPLLKLGGARVDLGLGGWGGAQRGATRLDIGPSLGARLRLGPGAIRLSLDWRQRIAGDARPGSGPVLVVGGDF